MPEFHELVERFLERGGKKALAEQLGMTPSGLGRALEAGTLKVENALLLAKTLGVAPDVVLRAAGKGQVADLLMEFFGEARQSLPADEAEALRLYQSLEPAVKKAMLQLLRVQADPAVRHGHPPQVERARKSAG